MACSWKIQSTDAAMLTVSSSFGRCLSAFSPRCPLICQLFVCLCLLVTRPHQSLRVSELSRIRCTTHGLLVCLHPASPLVGDECVSCPGKSFPLDLFFSKKKNRGWKMEDEVTLHAVSAPESKTAINVSAVVLVRGIFFFFLSVTQ